MDGAICAVGMAIVLSTVMLMALLHCDSCWSRGSDIHTVMRVAGSAGFRGSVSARWLYAHVHVHLQKGVRTRALHVREQDWTPQTPQISVSRSLSTPYVAGLRAGLAWFCGVSNPASFQRLTFLWESTPERKSLWPLKIRPLRRDRLRPTDLRSAPKDQARIRVQISAAHTRENLRKP